MPRCYLSITPRVTLHRDDILHTMPRSQSREQVETHSQALGSDPTGCSPSGLPLSKENTQADKYILEGNDCKDVFN